MVVIEDQSQSGSACPLLFPIFRLYNLFLESGGKAKDDGRLLWTDLPGDDKFM